MAFINCLDNIDHISEKSVQKNKTKIQTKMFYSTYQGIRNSLLNLFELQFSTFQMNSNSHSETE